MNGHEKTQTTQKKIRAAVTGNFCDSCGVLFAFFAFFRGDSIPPIAAASVR
jgi:hypothetical protein